MHGQHLLVEPNKTSQNSVASNLRFSPETIFINLFRLETPKDSWHEDQNVMLRFGIPTKRSEKQKSEGVLLAMSTLCALY